MRRVTRYNATNVSAVVATLAIVATGFAVYTYANQFNKATSGSITENTTCAAGSFLDSNCLPPSGAQSGTYVNPMLAVDDTGRIVSIENGTDSEVIVMESFTVYVDGQTGNDMNDGLTPLTAKQTFMPTLELFQNVVATQCILVVTTFVELGTDPVLDFFPESNNCKEIIVRGVRTNVVTDTVSALTEIEPTSYRWLQVTGTTGSYGQSTYECQFMQDLNTTFSYAVLNNTDNTIESPIVFNADISVGNTFQLFNITSEFRWTGSAIVTARIGIIFEDLVFSPQDPDSDFQFRTSGTTLVKSSTLYSYQAIIGPGPYFGTNFQVQGCQVKPLEATVFVSWCVDTNSTIFSNRFNRIFLFRCNDVIWSGIYTLGNSQQSIRQITQFSATIIGLRAVGGVLLEQQSEVVFISCSVTRMAIVENSRVWLSNVDISGLFSVSDQSSVFTQRLGTISAQSILVEEGASLRIGSIFGSTVLNCNSIEVENMASLSMVATGWNGNSTGTGQPLIRVSQGSQLHISNIFSSTLSSESAAQPLLSVQSGSTATYSGGGFANSGFPGSVIQCGTNAVSAWATPENDLTTNCFCTV